MASNSLNVVEHIGNIRNVGNVRRYVITASNEYPGDVISTVDHEGPRVSGLRERTVLTEVVITYDSMLFCDRFIALHIDIRSMALIHTFGLLAGRTIFPNILARFQRLQRPYL